MKSIKSITDKLTHKDSLRIAVFRHPHRQQLKYYPHVVGLKRKPDMDETIWLNKHTKGNYSIDHTTPPHNISFVEKRDAMYFKLVWFGDLACDKHRTV